MNSSLQRVLVTLFAFAFILAACSSGSGIEWTPAPDGGTDPDETPIETAAPVEPTEPVGSEEPVEPAETAEPTAEPAETTEPVGSEEPVASPSGEARVIELQADSALRFTDATGQPVPDIPVTPGETVIFRVDNTAGFAHNMYIGTDAELSVPSATTEVGIADWSTGVEELEWVVPDDVSGLKFACTVPGHYFTMQGTFSAAGPVEPADPAAAEPEEPAEPAAAAATEEPAAPEEPQEAEEPATEPAAATEGEARVIELEADAAIRFLQDGEQIQDLEVTPGETVIFRVDNTAGFPHNLYIGSDAELRVMGGVTDVGIPDWDLGVQELEWVVPDDVSELKFACTVPGHYYTMNGTFTATDAEEPADADEPADTEAAGLAIDDEAFGRAEAARMVKLVAASSLTFTDREGQRVTDIPVTPGETLRFQVENTAGIPLNFWIGSDAEISVPNGTTGAGIADWTSGVQELEWVVPDDVSGLKYAATVPCLHLAMQGTFSVSGGSTTTVSPAEAAVAIAPEPALTTAKLTTDVDEARVIELEADPANRFLQDGEQIQDIEVVPGETVIFRIDNTAGFPHNFYIGLDSELQIPGGTTDFGIPDWETGVQEFAWVVPEDIDDLRFACTVPGHYYLMQGEITLRA